MLSKELIVAETFLSLQGESTYAGCLCFFIRLAGCNLKCNYCDTRYSRTPEDGTPISIQELLDFAIDSDADMVEITGGEPLTQKNTHLLARALLDKNFCVLLETNGSLPIKSTPQGVIRIMDCKTPSSGEAEKLDRSNFEELNKKDEVKFVISDRNDFKYSIDIIKEYGIDKKTKNIIFSPAWGDLPPKKLAEWMIKEKPPARIQLQLHKYIWGPDKKGV
jgi:7-carboxy-7-deazaguanine synthase